ncbi:MAG: LPS export ABC transporter periplasmic protein LptC [Acidobacteriia bacterium]|nr:LPS export ABC transporter periplasmic protein LptC [Terriglobia bacterium]
MLVVLVVCGFYIRGLLRVNRTLGKIEKIASNLAQSTTGFTFSKSEGGRTLFTIHAAQARQYKDDGRATLHDVSIIVYGRDARRFDQIYGTDFEYDQRTGEVVAKGEVHIDLESDSSGILRPDQAPPQEMKNPIHLKTSGLTFNQKTGFAETRERIEFRIPEAVGSAVGATYDSKSNILVLKSAVRLTTTEKQKAVITAQSATFTKDPRRADLLGCRVEQELRAMQAEKVTLLLREDNTLDRVLASGNVHIEDTSPRGFDVKAPQGEMVMGPRQQMKNGVLSGGVAFENRGPSPGKGTAGRLLFDFGRKNELVKARAEDSVAFSQNTSSSSIGLKSDALDLLVAAGGRKLDKAVTSGAAQIIRTEGATRYTITAGVFQGKFNAANRLAGVTGTSNAQVVATTPGQPDRVSTSRDLVASFDAKGAISLVEQRGDFQYREGQRTATAEAARLVPADDIITLTGSPRVVDSGVTLTALGIQLNRKANTAFAQGQVKTTFSELKQQPGGVLSSADPIHVTGSSMVASRNTESAKFTNARLWQGKNIVEAPVINFDRAHRNLQAQGSAAGRVSAVFVQTRKETDSAPINVLADRLSYLDAERKATFSGNVLARTADMITSAESIQLLLLPGGGPGSNQLDKMIAQGDVRVQQPNRKASGDQVVYTAQEGKFVMTGTNTSRPTIYDAEKGRVTGDSLTFYIHDDRVLVDSHTIIQTHIPDTSKK